MASSRCRARKGASFVSTVEAWRGPGAGPVRPHPRATRSRPSAGDRRAAGRHETSITVGDARPCSLRGVARTPSSARGAPRRAGGRAGTAWPLSPRVRCVAGGPARGVRSPTRSRARARDRTRDVVAPNPAARREGPRGNGGVRLGSAAPLRRDERRRRCGLPRGEEVARGRAHLGPPRPGAAFGARERATAGTRWGRVGFRG